MGPLKATISSFECAKVNDLQKKQKVNQYSISQVIESVIANLSKFGSVLGKYFFTAEENQLI